MTGPQDRKTLSEEDDNWLEALAGRPAPALGAAELAEVEQLRQAWTKRKARLETTLPEVSDEFVQRLLDRNAQEDRQPSLKIDLQPKAITGINVVAEEIPPGTIPTHRRLASNRSNFVWGLAASVMFSAVLFMYMEPMGSDDLSPVARNALESKDESRVVVESESRRVLITSSHTVIEVFDRDREYAEIQERANHLKVDINVKRQTNGDYEINIPSTLAGTELFFQTISIFPNRSGSLIIQIKLLKSK